MFGFDISRLLNNFIFKRKYFSFESLNNHRIQYFNYYGPVEIKPLDRPGPLKKKN